AQRDGRRWAAAASQRWRLRAPTRRWGYRDGRGLDAAAICSCRRQRRWWRAGRRPSRRQGGWQPWAAFVGAENKRGGPGQWRRLDGELRGRRPAGWCGGQQGRSRLGSHGGLGQRHLLDGALPAAEERALFHAALDLPSDLDQLHDLAFGHRRTIVGSLPVLAANRAQEGDILLRFDALGHHLLAELVGQGHDRAQNDRAGTVLTAGLD